MTDDQYLSLLDRAKNCLPETIVGHERFSLPEIDVLQEGKITVIRNFIDITDKLRRDPLHVLQYLLRELGTPGNVEGRRAVLKAKLSIAQISDRVQEYTDTFVICSECGLPDTHMNKEGRTLVLECEACGARRPVNAKKSSKANTSSELRAGDVVEILIHDMGKKGDGVGKLQNYLIVVPGTAKGARVRVKITNISGTTAFGSVTQDAATK
ncbi:MAG: translation initiation factor IF-2 subunit beta [Methanomassiliicoccaceae archaeon]|jgi:translation initiation factor 2 subunit 2|nr:translation initiation factor IF-2 subunit beta [Methanomassiliicoccaceae archaeon]